MTRQINKAIHCGVSARSEFWEAGFYIDASKARTRKSAKRDSKRANRRTGKLLCSEGV